MRLGKRTALLLALGFGTGCASLFNLDEYHVIEGDAGPGGTDSGGSEASLNDSPTGDDGQVDGTPPPECTTNAECTATLTAQGPIDAGLPDVAPDVDAGPIYNGTLDGGVVPGVCVRSVGKCARLLNQDCRAFSGDYTNENAIVLGTFFNLTGSISSSSIPRNQAAVLAAEEINSPSGGGGIPAATDGGPVRPLVVLQCDPAGGVIRTAQHLVNELHVPAIIGPNVGQDVIDVTQQVSAAGGTLLMSPTVTADAVTHLLDQGLTFRDVPSDTQRAKLFIQQINDVETAIHTAHGTTTQTEKLKLGIIYRTDALGLSVLNSISGKLIFNGAFLSDAINAAYVSQDHYDSNTNIPSQTAIAAKYATFQPDIVIVTAIEQVADIVIPLEQTLSTDGGAGATRPYYVANDASKVKQWLTGVTAPNIPADFRTRVRGIGVRPDGLSASVFAQFNSSFVTRYGANPGTSNMGNAYDAMYSVAFALAATRSEPPSGASVAKGLLALGSGDAINVGISSAGGAMQALSGGKSIQLRGTFSLMQWDTNGDIAGGTLEVWCIGAPSGVAAFGSSGVTMDVQTQTIGGTFTQCN
jgi:ABC-type branched-subunit amino acid transport system substrate-binding protein